MYNKLIGSNEMSLMSEFKAFALKGNVVDLAVAVLIGAAFGKIVEAVVNGILNPLIGMVGGSPNIDLKVGAFDIGLVVNSVISFLTMALVIFFVFVKPASKLQQKLGIAPDA